MEVVIALLVLFVVLAAGYIAAAFDLERTAYAFALLAPVLAAGAGHAARTSPPDHPSTATTETLGAIEATDGWCIPTNGTTALDLDAAAPARVTSALKARVRFVTVRFIAGATSTRICHRVGGALVAAACNALDTDAVGVLTDAQSATYAIARDPTAGGLPELEAQANAGADGSVCVTVGW